MSSPEGWARQACFLWILILVGCNAAKAPQRSSETFGPWGVDLGARELTTGPGDDFHAYASGSWLRQTSIPDDEQRVSLLGQLGDQVEAKLLMRLKDLQTDRTSRTGVQVKLLDVYTAWKGFTARDAMGLAPLEPLLNQIDRADDIGELTTLMAEPYGPAPFELGIVADPVDPSRYIAFVLQAGLGMGERTYYLAEDSVFVGYREAYLRYVTTLFRLAGLEASDDRAMAVVTLESKMANAHWTQERSLVVEEVYNPMSQAELAALAPDFDWRRALAYRGLADIDTVLVVQPSAISESAKILRQAPMQVAKDYLRFQLLNEFSSDLTTEFAEARFEFFERALRGIESPPTADAQAMAFLNRFMGNAVGKVYVDAYFPESSKSAMTDLTQLVINAFEKRLRNNPWMDEGTREEALTKLRLVEPRIGYPDQWLDYTNVATSPEDHIGNRLALAAFEWQQELLRLDGPVDRQRWAYPPHAVSAYYDAQVNQITLLAGMLQPPVFDPAADPAVNFGAIGAIIGHELGHGFDSTGRLFDGHGVLRDWWTEQSDKQFQKREYQLIEQYNNYEVIPGVFINGALTISENIGDLGGLQIAHTAYRSYLESCCDGRDRVIDGLTGDQRFFLAWAQMWRGKSRDDALRHQVLTAEHSPLKYRVNGVVRNMDAWYDAFDVTQNDELYLPPEARVAIW